jgi:diphosphomevalonate decarboxylase
MEGHPYKKARIEQAKAHMVDMHQVLSSGDMDRFVEIVENEALSLHGLMLASNPGYLLMEANTLRIIEEVRAFRMDTQIPLCFTLDAGPNVHLLYPAEYKGEIRSLIENRLNSFCADGRWLDDGMGQGPKQLAEA